MEQQILSLLLHLVYNQDYYHLIMFFLFLADCVFSKHFYILHLIWFSLSAYEVD